MIQLRRFDSRQDRLNLIDGENEIEEELSNNIVNK
jgi:hypothetical protein